MKKATTNNKKSNRITIRTLGLWVAFLLIFMAELFSYTWCRVKCVQTGYELSNTLQEHGHLVALQKNLRIELTHLRSPKRISKIAKDKLGLIIPNPEQIIVIQ